MMNPASLGVVISVQNPMIKVEEIISVGRETTPEYWRGSGEGKKRVSTSPRRVLLRRPHA